MENQTDQIQNPTPPVSEVPQAAQTPPLGSLASPNLGGPESSTKAAKSKLHLLIIGAVLFLLLAGSAAGFYVYKLQSSKSVKPTPIVQKQTPSPTEALAKEGTPNPTANWKIYTNEKYGLSVKYPEKLELTEQTGPYGKGVFLASFLYHPSGPEECIQIRLSVITIDPSENLSGWIKKEYPNSIYGKRTNGDGGGGPGFTPPPIQIAPYTNSVDKNITGYLVAGQQILIEKNNRLVSLESPGCGPGEDLTNNPKTSEIMEQMIATYKFTDSKTEYISEPLTFSDGSYRVYLTGEHLVSINDKNEKPLFQNVVDDTIWQGLVQKMQIADGLKNQGQIGLQRGSWKSSTTFTLKLLNAFGNEFEFEIDASTGKVNDSYFKQLK